MAFQSGILALPLAELTGMVVTGSDITLNVLIAIPLAFLVEPMIDQYFGVFEGVRIELPTLDG